MAAYVKLQEKAFAADSSGYTATKHQREGGAGCLDLVAGAIDAQAEPAGLAGSTGQEQFA